MKWELAAFTWGESEYIIYLNILSLLYVRKDLHKTDIESYKNLKYSTRICHCSSRLAVLNAAQTDKTWQYADGAGLLLFWLCCIWNIMFKYCFNFLFISVLLFVNNTQP